MSEKKLEQAIADALVPSGSDALDGKHGALARSLVADRIIQAIYAAGYQIEGGVEVPGE